MSGFRKLVIIDFKLYLREPISTFFTLAFPILIVILFGAMYGNNPEQMFGGYGSMDISMPAYTGMILGTVGFLGIPITLSGYRETGVLRRFRTTPMRPITYIVADVISNLVMTLIGMVGMLLVGWLIYRVRFEGNVLSVIGGVILGGLTMFSIGYLVASVAPGARSAQVIGMVIFYPMMFLSGASIPLEIMPETIRKISNFLPLTYVVKILRGLWFGDSWRDHLLDLSILFCVLIVCSFLAARFFKWE